MVRVDLDGQEQSCLISVIGLVQGVGFRWFVLQKARALKLDGWVRNLDDGSVEALAAGPKLAVDQLLHCLREGPEGSRVDAVTLRPAELASSAPHRPFRII